MKQENESEEDAHTPSPAEAVEPENPCIEYLQHAITRLLMKNETMRYELFSICQKLAVIDQVVFGSGSNDLRKRLPLYLVGALHDLCRCEAAGRHLERPPLEQSSEKVIRIRTNRQRIE